MKTALKGLAGIVVLAVLVWTATYLYWHTRILGALRALETGAASSEVQTASDVLSEAGCRGLPYLVGSLNPTRNTTLLTCATTHVALLVAAPGEPILYNPKVAERMKEWRIEAEDPPAVRQRKCDLIHAWWKDNGGRRHQTWRVWSQSCLP